MRCDIDRRHVWTVVGAKLRRLPLGGQPHCWTTIVQEVHCHPADFVVVVLEDQFFGVGEFSDDGETIMVGGIGLARAFHAKGMAELRELSRSTLRSTACQNLTVK